MGYLAKADGRVSEQEIAAARARDGGAAPARPRRCRRPSPASRAGKQSYFDLGTDLAGLCQACRGRPDLLRVFLEIQVRAALAGNNLEGPVRPLMNRVAATLRVRPFELAQIEAVLRIQRGGFRARGARTESVAAAGAELSLAYQVLGTAAAASDDEVVKSYRRQLSRHHPDKLKANGLPESMLAHAKQRTQQIIEAYELIRERRGMS